MLFHFVNTGQVHTSVIDAYSKFIQSHGHQSISHSNSLTVPDNASVVWWFCGHVAYSEALRLRSGFHIHEYLSASHPPFAWLKDQFMQWTTPVPDFRIFQNGWLRERMAFSDSIPYEFREEGLSEHFFEVPYDKKTPEFDFVYSGAILNLIIFKDVLQALEVAGRSLLVIGEMPSELQALVAPKVTFTGLMNYAEVPQQLRRAQFGLNLTQNITPFNQQASSNVLEYCASELRIVSNFSPWVRYFMHHHNANFYLLPDGAVSEAYNFGKGLEAFPYVVPNVSHLRLQNTIKELAIWKTFLV